MRIALLSCLLFFSNALLFSQTNYLQLYNQIGTNIYSTGHYASSFYGVEEVADIYISNYADQILAILIVSKHDYSKAAVFELLRPFYGMNNSYMDHSSADGIFNTNRGLIIGSMDWGAIIISGSLLKSEERVRDYIYNELGIELRMMIDETLQSQTTISSINRLLQNYRKLSGFDPLLVENIEFFINEQ